MGERSSTGAANERNAMRLDEEVRSALESSVVSGNRLTLTGQLDRKLYVKVAKALELMGGKWSKKERCHLFEGPAEDVVADAISTGAIVDFRKEFQFFETPPEIADQLVEWARILPYHSVLEPSAGRGRLIYAIRSCGAEPVACELWEPNREHLAAVGVELIGSDFLQLSGRSFDRIVANPPFAGQQDIAHVSHMWELLNRGGRLVSVMSPAWTYRNTKAARQFRELFDAANGEWQLLPEDAFKASGTGVQTGIVVLDKP